MKTGDIITEETLANNNWFVICYFGASSVVWGRGTTRIIWERKTEIIHGIWFE